MKVLVLGGSGFVGRSVVRALVAQGDAVLVGTRRLSRRGRAVLGSDAALIELHRLVRPEDWLGRIAPFDVIINCVGILRERWGETYDAVYRDAPIALATACAALGKRLIHITALGLSATAGSGFITAKSAGERGIEGIAGEICVVRPSLLDGVDGFGSRWLRLVAGWPVYFVPADATGSLAPLHVDDLGEAIARLAVCAGHLLPRSVELGGETRCDIGHYLHLLRSPGRRPRTAVVIRVPAWMTRASAHLFDLVHLTPLSWGHVELLRHDNAPRPEDAAALRRWIGRAPLEPGFVARRNLPRGPAGQSVAFAGMPHRDAGVQHFSAEVDISRNDVTSPNSMGIQRKS